MRHQLFIAVSLLGLFLIYLFNFASDDEPGNISTTISFNTENFDYYIIGMDASRFNLDGSSDYRMQAESFIHFPEPDAAELIKPNMTFFEKDAAPWEVTSDTGKIEQDSQYAMDRLDLVSNVVIHKTLEDQDQLELLTESLSTWPDRNFLSTALPVLIRTNYSTTTGIGMEANIETSKIRLLANVEGTYAQ